MNASVKSLMKEPKPIDVRCFLSILGNVMGLYLMLQPNQTCGTGERAEQLLRHGLYLGRWISIIFVNYLFCFTAQNFFHSIIILLGYLPAIIAYKCFQKF